MNSQEIEQANAEIEVLKATGSSKKENVNRFLAVWDCNGLESIFDVNKELRMHEEWEKENIFTILNEEEIEPRRSSIPLTMLILRARANIQREYEIYQFTTTMSMKEVKDVFKNSPQIIVDWIRENGAKIHSDYSKRERAIS